MSVNLSLFAGAGAQFFNDNGVPLAGGLIYTYLAGTNTLTATYTSSTGLIAHANPIVLNAAGRVSTGEIWITAGLAYKFILKNAAGVQIGSYDNIPSFLTMDSANVTYLPAGTGAVSTTVQDKLRELVTRQDYDSDTNASLNLKTWQLGYGDLQQVYTSTVGQILDIRKGSTAIPDTVTDPIVKTQRYLNVLTSAITGDGGEEMASIYGVSKGATTNEAQPVGVYGGAVSQYSGSGANKGDACGIYGASRFTGSGVGTAIGGFFTGRTDTPTGRTTALELAAQNFGGVAKTFNTAGYSDGTGIWLTALGDADLGVGFALGNGFGQQFEVGIGFTNQTTGGKVGPVSGTTLLDLGSATTSISIQGIHTTAFAIGTTAGNVVIGQNGPAATGVKLFVKSTDDAQSIAILRGNSATQSADLFRVENYLGSSLFLVNGVGNIVMSNLPTAPTGLPAGALWKDTASGNVIKVV